MDPEDLLPDPHAQFDRWFAEAVSAAVLDPEQMALATAAPDGAPSVRMVLLKGHDQRGFVFYTNRTSRKGSELAANPRAAGVLHWKQLERQVRVEGSVEELSDDESDAYFRTRPRASQIGAWASPQSQPIEGRGVLEHRVAEIEARFAAQERVPLPPFWGGFRIVATTIEFWQGRSGRLHDRVEYVLGSDGWRTQRLAP